MFSLLCMSQTFVRESEDDAMIINTLLPPLLEAVLDDYKSNIGPGNLLFLKLKTMGCLLFQWRKEGRGLILFIVHLLKIFFLFST